MSLPRAVQTSWTPHPGAPVFRRAFALETFASARQSRNSRWAGWGHGLGGRGAASGITSWALPLPLETADLGGGLSVLAYFPPGSQPLPASALCPRAPPLGEVDPLESAKAPGEKLLAPRARRQTAGLRHVRAPVSPVRPSPPRHLLI